MFGFEAKIKETKRSMSAIEQYNAYSKVSRTIERCKRPIHLIAAARMITFYERMYGASPQLVDLFYAKTMQLI